MNSLGETRAYLLFRTFSSAHRKQLCRSSLEQLLARPAYAPCVLASSKCGHPEVLYPVIGSGVRALERLFVSTIHSLEPVVRGFRPSELRCPRMTTGMRSCLSLVNSFGA